MEAKAYLYDLRISPRKVSIVLDLIRNKDVATAAGILAIQEKLQANPLPSCLNQQLQTQKTITAWTFPNCMCHSAL